MIQIKAHRIAVSEHREDEKTSMIGLVDDDDATRDAIRFLLECEALSVRDFPSCAAHLEMAACDEADCLILDIHMPGMSGLELLEQLRAEGATMPIILMTGRPTPAIERRAAAAGAVAVLEKPFRGNHLVDIVRRALDGAAGRISGT